MKVTTLETLTAEKRADLARRMMDAADVADLDGAGPEFHGRIYTLAGLVTSGGPVGVPGLVVSCHQMRRAAALLSIPKRKPGRLSVADGIRWDEAELSRADAGAALFEIAGALEIAAGILSVESGAVERCSDAYKAAARVCNATGKEAQTAADEWRAALRALRDNGDDCELSNVLERMWREKGL